MGTNINLENALRKDKAFGAPVLTDIINGLSGQSRDGILQRSGIFKEVGVRNGSVRVRPRKVTKNLLTGAPRDVIANIHDPSEKESFLFDILGYQVISQVSNVEVEKTPTEQENQMSIAEYISERLQEMLDDSLIPTRTSLQMGAVKGLIVDPYTGNTVSDIYDLYGQTRPASVNLTFNDATTVNSIVGQLQEALSASLGLGVENIVVLMGANIWEKFQNLGTFNILAQGGMSQFTLRNPSDPIEWNGATFMKLPTHEGFGADDGCVFPAGPDVFRSYVAPPPTEEFTGTVGKAFYAFQGVKTADFKENLVGSHCGLHICVMPQGLIQLTST